MRGKSHQCLGRYLAEQYMSDLPKRYVKAFLIGCIEPDRNPTTYFKGSIREQWLRGHNWDNSQRYIQRVACRLDAKDHKNIFDYFIIGRLIHYTTDAFTSAHNKRFGTDLSEHRAYEVELQEHFLDYLAEKPDIWTDTKHPVVETIQSYHWEYLRRPVNIHTDSRFAIIVCCMVAARLFAH